MSTRLKKKRRLIYLALGLVLLGVVGGVAYAFRTSQLNARLARGREEGVAALAAGDYSTALHKIGLYLQRNGDDAEALYQYAQAREQVPMPDRRNIGQAIAQYRRLLILRPSHTDARRRLLKLYVENGFTQEAIDTAEKLDKDDPEALRAIAMARWRQRKYPEAGAAAKQYNQAVPDDLKMQRLTFDIMLAQGTSAEQVVERAQDLEQAHPGQGRFELLTGIAHRAAGNATAARESFKKAAARESDTEPTFVGALVEQLEALELFEDSLRVSSRAANQGASENQRLYVGRLYQAERYQDVVDRLRDLNAADRKADAELLALRSLSLSRLGRADEARPVVAALAERFDVDAEAWHPVLKVALGAPAAPHKDVIRACSESLRRTPANPYFHHFLAEAFSAVGEQDLAIRYWAESSRLAPAWAEPRSRLAMLYLAAGRPREAVLLARSAEERATNDADVLRTLAETLSNVLLASRGKTDAPIPEELRTTIARIDKLDPKNTFTAALRALPAAAEGKRDEAIAAARAVLDAPAAAPDSAYITLATISRAFDLGITDECLERCEKAHGRVTPALATYRARTLLAASKAAEGKQVLQSAKAGAKDPADVKAWRVAWAAYLDTTADPEAKQAWTALAEDFRDEAGIQALALRTSCLQGDREFLKTTIDRLEAATSPDSVGWRLARARWIATGATGADKSAQLAKAASVLGDLSRDMPELPEPRILLARCLQELGNPREAIEQLSRVVATTPQHYSTRLELASLLQSRGDYAGAKTHLDAVADEPSAPVVDRVAAASLLARGGDTDKALALLERLQPPGATAADGPVPTLLLAELYRKNGDTAAAKVVCGKLLLGKSPDPGAIGLLADILASEGKTAEAEQVLARLDQATAPDTQKQLIRGRYYAAQGDRARALEQFTAVTRSAPTSAAAWRMLAKHHLAGGELPQALATADAAAKASVRDDGLQALQRVAAALPQGSDGIALLPLIGGVVDTPADEPAVSEMLKALAQAKQNSSAPALLAKVRDIAGRYPRALTVQNVAARATMVLGGQAGAEEGLAIAMRAMQNFPAASEPAEAATAALASLGRWDEAAVIALQWKHRAPGVAGPDLVMATSHLARGRADQARAVLEPYVSKPGAAAAPGPDKPHVAQATILYCQALATSGKVAEAEKLLGGRIKDSPQYRAAWMEIASRYLPDDDAAVRWLDAAAQATPEAARAAFGEQAALAEAWVVLATRTGKPAHKERALAVVRALATKTGESPEATAGQWVATGILCEGAGDRAAAEAAYNRALQKNPAEPVALNNLAMILSDRDETAVAEKLATQAAAREHPRRASFYDTLATVQAKGKQWSRAGDSIQKALALDPTNPGFQIHQAVILTSAGDAARARGALNAVEGIRLEDPRLNNTDRERLKSLRQRAESGS